MSSAFLKRYPGMQLSDFCYDLPPELIAQYPLKKRDAARMMVIRREDGSITHDVFKHLNRYVPPQTQFVLNNSRVIPARLLGVKEQTGAQIEIFLLKRLEENIYEVLLRPLKRLREGGKVSFEGGLTAEVVDKERRIVRFNKKNIQPFLKKYGHMPLPPYIKRSDEKSDQKTYQTVYAKKDGSVAAPTAGLHFTRTQMQDLKKAGHRFREVTLHIGYGTFQPVETEQIEDHPMHVETYAVSPRVWKQLEGKGPVCAVGTTATRVLESAAQTGRLSGDTNLFIYPGFSFKMVDLLLTNFHLPHSTLLMLVSAFGGMDLIRRAYSEAIAQKYRFYSYGDCMLII